jgi:DNA-binding transcriptional LysR family regulator
VLSTFETFKQLLVFTTRRGLPPAVRALIDYIAEHFRDEMVTTTPIIVPNARNPR